MKALDILYKSYGVTKIYGVIWGHGGQNKRSNFQVCPISKVETLPAWRAASKMCVQKFWNRVLKTSNRETAPSRQAPENIWMKTNTRTAIDFGTTVRKAGKSDRPWIHEAGSRVGGEVGSAPLTGCPGRAGLILALMPYQEDGASALFFLLACQMV